MLSTALAAGAVSIAAANALLERQIAQQTALVQQLQSENDKLDVQLQELDALKLQAVDLRQQEQQLLALLQRQHQPPALLQMLAQQTPAQIQLRSLKQQANAITLSGNASSSADVMWLLANLHGQNGLMRDAALQETQAIAL